MEQKKPRTFIIGVGMTRFYKPVKDNSRDYPTLAEQAARRALHDAGVSYTDIEQGFCGYVYGDSTCGQRSLYQVGISGIPI